jgi:hypothetical protein
VGLGEARDRVDRWSELGRPRQCTLTPEEAQRLARVKTMAGLPRVARKRK